MSDLAGSAASQTGDGTGNGAGAAEITKPTWIEQLPEAMRSDETLYGHKTIGDLVTDYKAKSTAGDGMIRVPGENSTAEEKAAYAKAIGVPESPDKYEIGKPQDYPEGLPYDENVQEAFKQYVFEKQMPVGMAKDIWSWYHGLVKSGAAMQAENDKKALDTMHEALTKEWGDKYEANGEIALRIFKALGGEDIKDLLGKRVDGVLLDHHPAFLRAFHAIGVKVGDDTTGGPAGGGLSEKTAEERAFEMFPSMKPK